MNRLLRLKQKVKMHNEFHLVLTDSRTGKVKQEAWAYNIITNQGLDQITSSWTHDGGGTLQGVLGFISLGTGTGVLDVTRTALFSYLDSKNHSQHDHDMDNAELTAKKTQVATWDENEIQNSSITEVGRGRESTLRTHALIEDSEGNPITVEKGEFDILTVYSTIYGEIEAHSYGTNLDFVTGDPIIGDYKDTGRNMILQWVGRDSDPGRSEVNPHSWRVMIGRSSTSPSRSDAVNLDYFFSWGLAVNINTGNRTCNVSTRVEHDRANDPAGIWEIGFIVSRRTYLSMAWRTHWCSLCRSVMPLDTVWEGFNVEGEELGTGDDAQTVFETQWAPVVAESDAVYVDGNLQTRDTHYTINNETGAITFTVAPGDGLAVTADYSILQIPKDENHVLDVSFTLQFADANA